MPVVVELSPVPDVEAALRAVADLPHPVLFESALERAGVGEYSFLSADPYEFRQLDRATHGSDPFAELRALLSCAPAETLPDLPPFQGGAAGVLGYGLGCAWERVPTARFDEFRVPDLAVGVYDWVLAWDHRQGRAWIISHGWPEPAEDQRRGRAARRAELIGQRLARTAPPSIPAPRPVPPVELAPQFPVAGIPRLTSCFSREQYLRGVERAIEYIRAGDIFQVNLTQRLVYPAELAPIDLYCRLRDCNPAPFAGYFDGGNWALVSASPERFVCVRGDEVETRPIKGTRRRKSQPEADLFTRDELRESEKDQAENVMIVDLLRNDLSRVCRPGSIRVPQLCGVETYETVQHLVSEVRGTLEPGRCGWDVLAATFPGGSITGAPKVRAMEIISELEPVARGPYCGSLFYLGFDGALDSSILIRSFVSSGGWLQCGVGGGIVAQSDPELEYEETLHKAAGMLRALGLA